VNAVLRLAKSRHLGSFEADPADFSRETPFLPSTWLSPPAAPTRPDEPTIPEPGQCSRCRHDAYQEKRTEKRVSLN